MSRRDGEETPSAHWPEGSGGGDPGDPIEKLKDQEVVVRAAGITYRGILLGADEEELYLRTNTRYVSVRMDRISQMEAADAEQDFDATKQVDADFYNVDDLNGADSDGDEPDAADSDGDEPEAADPDDASES